MSYVAANNAVSTLASGISVGDVTVLIQAADAAKFPTVNQGGTGADHTYLTLSNSESVTEIVKVTRHDAGSASLMVVRAQDGTAAHAYNTGDSVELRVVAAAINEKADTSNLGTAATSDVQANGTDKTPGRVLLTGASIGTLAGFNPAAFYKADPYSVAFLKTAANAVSIKAGTYVMVAGTMISFAAQTPVVMPALTAGTDYAIYACTDGSIRADASFTAPAGYTSGNSRQIGGFHYAPGGNAPARAGGDMAPAINQFSLWDLKWRPACIDPRGMTLVANNFWADIYMTGVDHIANGTSKYNVAIARGTTPPKVPLEFGGDGSLAYGSMTWWEAAEVARSHGKQLPTYDQFAALAFGTTEQVASGGTDVPTTGKTGTGATSAWNAFTSKWGAVQSSGCVWTWGREFVVNSAVNAGFAFQSETAGRGGIYENGPLSVVAALFGANWDNGSSAGSRASYWINAPSYSGSFIGLRCVRDHLILV